MTEQRGPAYMIGVRAEERVHHPIPGTRLINCELCQAPTRFAPSSLNHAIAGEAQFICLVCAVELPERPSVVLEPSKEQLRELRAVLKPK